MKSFQLYCSSYAFVHREEGIQASSSSLQKQTGGDTYYMENCGHHFPLQGEALW